MTWHGRRLLDRCGGSAGGFGLARLRLLLPVELRRVNHGASTNGRHFSLKAPRRMRPGAGPGLPSLPASLSQNLQLPPMSAADSIDQIAERVERLLVRHEELRRTNGLLGERLEAVTRERDALRLRLEAVVGRIDAVLARWPAEAEAASPKAGVLGGDGHAGTAHP
ncbi:MAG: hypothetical protein JWQ03_1692 [Variovorax sp.]|nr:hypothetical protein [Variovorax sp.]